MVENLLLIAKDLLKALNSVKGFTEEEKEYIVSVIRKIILAAILELKKMDLYQDDSFQNII